MVTIEGLSRSLAPQTTQESRAFEWAELPRTNQPWRIATYSGQGGITHAVLVLGEVNAKEALVRIHSECLTGDVLGSLRCDCGEQLAISFREIEAKGSGLIIYLREHEGRGIGLAEKIRAYRLQDNGLDTVDANLALGHEIDQRDYHDAVEILRKLQISKVTLLTNNPDKIESLRASGIETEIKPLLIAPNDFNRAYLKAKGKRLGHRFDLTAENKAPRKGE